jgi:hypothetical protein
MESPAFTLLRLKLKLGICIASDRVNGVQNVGSHPVALLSQSNFSLVAGRTINVSGANGATISGNNGGNGAHGDGIYNANVDFDCCTVVVPHNLSEVTIASVNVQAAAVEALCADVVCSILFGDPLPSGYFVIGDGAVIEPKQ